MFSPDGASAIPRLDTSTKPTWRQRRNLANTNALSQYEADLTNEDRYKQKEAVRRYLAEKVRDDWSFQWPSYHRSPSVSSQALSISDTDMICEFPEEQEWKEREEWLSDAGIDTCDDGQDQSKLISSPGSAKNSPGCSENTERTKNRLNKKLLEFKRKRNVELEKELAYNDGLRCFTARRDAWTGARAVHTLVPGSSPKLSLDQSMKENHDGQKAGIDQCKLEEIIVPVGRLILPAGNFVRSSISPRSYNFIYDKIVLNSNTPTCPINLRDMIQSCVQGWKRDGQWPPASIEVNRLFQKQSDHQALSSLFSHDIPDSVLDEGTRPGENEDKKKESIDEQSQKQRGRAREKKGKDFKERNRGLNSCFNRILGRGL
ncbi:putative mitochondrial aaa protein [Erysiphe neolycopersici]|uniref:Putative mitochondrial aaa protein n=1 Tax=Erysiphe neolycopersici TaxID=212602 RepID=A0A420HQP3_9PEZI|nr:putative mitochondrial aaa protein [Erysiphe neolycopersici]